jgi:septum formation protein
MQTLGKVILASSSPRRFELLKLIGIDFEVMPSFIQENLKKNELPEDHVTRLSAAKAVAIAVTQRDAWVIGADTIVVLGNNIFGKPTTPLDARIMLMQLSGQRHEVYTGFAIARNSEHTIISEVVRSSVLFKDITEDEINWYIGTDEPYDKAGGYALQGAGAFFIKELSGSYTNVIGLPLCELVNALKKLDVITFLMDDWSYVTSRR